MNLLEESDKSGLYIRHAIDEKPVNTGAHFHIHDRCEIFCFISGNAQYLVEGSVYPLERNSLLIMRPGEAHCIRFLRSERYERYAVNFPISVFDGFDPERRLMKPFTDRPLGIKNLFRIPESEAVFREIFRNTDDDYGRTLLITTKLIFLMDKICRETALNDSETDTPDISGQIVRYVNDMLYEDISIEKLAEHFFLSSSQFSRLFRKATGTSPWAYITAKRLIAAKDMLRSGATAKKAAESCGFNDYSVFYKAYVKRYGESPGKQL